MHPTTTSTLRDRIQEVAKKQTSYVDQMKTAFSGDIPLLLSKPHLQMLLVLIENVDDLESQGHLELSDEEKAYICELYERASATYAKHEEKQNPQPYPDQAAYLSKKRTHGSKG